MTFPFIKALQYAAELQAASRRLLEPYEALKEARKTAVAQWKGPHATAMGERLREERTDVEVLTIEEMPREADRWAAFWHEEVVKLNEERYQAAIKDAEYTAYVSKMTPTGTTTTTSGTPTTSHTLPSLPPKYREVPIPLAVNSYVVVDSIVSYKANRLGNGAIHWDVSYAADEEGTVTSPGRSTGSTTPTTITTSGSPNAHRSRPPSPSTTTTTTTSPPTTSPDPS